MKKSNILTIGIIGAIVAAGSISVANAADEEGVTTRQVEAVVNAYEAAGPSPFGGLSDVETVVTKYTPPVNERPTVEVMCPNGKIALGGGFDAEVTSYSDTIRGQIWTSAPIVNEDGVSVGWRYYGAPAQWNHIPNIDVYAICATP